MIMGDGQSEQGISFIDESSRDILHGVNLELPPIKTEFPFSESVGDFVGKGRESTVWNLGPEWVIKNANRLNELGKTRTNEQIEKMRSAETIKTYNKEQQRLEEIFGKDNFRRTYFVYGKDLSGKEGYLAVQKMVVGEQLVKDGESLNEGMERRLLLDNREEFKKIIWAVKKVIVEYGLPGDFHLGNLIKESVTGNLVFVDFGSPSMDSNFIFNDDSYESKSPYLIENAIKRLERLDRYVELLNLSKQEVEDLNSQFSFSEEEYDKRTRRLEDRVVELENIKKEIEVSDKVNAFLDKSFGTFDGGDISKAMMMDKIREIPTTLENSEAIKVLIDKLRDLDTVGGSKDLWRQILKRLN